ncbi:MAG: molybdate ABC transporter substrate-binding protein [Propionicimonas sp.]|nr:molybdate ABC transporter substrate-binding protein [Propionicimonas sp.]
MSVPARTLAAATAAFTLLLAGCAQPAAPAGSASAEPAAATLTVFAAASLKGSFGELGELFEAAHPGTAVSFNFAGSQTLVEQLGQGAAADVLATADEKSMATAVADGLVEGDPTLFVSNRLTIVVPPGNPASVAGFADLATPGLRLVVCAPVVPCGAAAGKVATAAGTTLTPVSEEQAVTDVLAKVQAGEADAGLVYATDALAAGDTVTAIAFPEAAAATNRYPIALLAAAPQPTLAAAFLELVTGDEGRAVFDRAGFGRP